jgi:pre-mRNA-splicing factor 18
MDFLKKELERKRKAAQEDFGGRKFVRRGELEQKSIEKLRNEEEEERQQKAAKDKVGAKGVAAEKQEVAAAKQEATTKSKAGENTSWRASMAKGVWSKPIEQAASTTSCGQTHMFKI